MVKDLRDHGEFPEVICAEDRFSFHNNQDADFSHEAKPDF
jgi:hypothetical protein